MSNRKPGKKIEINDLIHELLISGNQNVDVSEVLITLPVANQSQILARGIRDAIKSKNFICAGSLLRSLLESMMVLVYDISTKPPNRREYYKQFIEHKRLRRWSKNKKRWENVRDIHLIPQFEKATGINIEDGYSMMCDLLHFSLKQAQFISSQGKFDIKSGTVEFLISDKGPEFSNESYKKLTQLTDFALDQIKQAIAISIVKKRESYGEPKSIIAEKTLDGKKIVQI